VANDEILSMQHSLLPIDYCISGLHLMLRNNWPCSPNLSQNVDIFFLSKSNHHSNMQQHGIKEIKINGEEAETSMQEEK